MNDKGCGSCCGNARGVGAARRVNVGVIGFGTIGAGVVKALQVKKVFLADKCGIELNVTKVCDKDLKSKRPVRVGRKILTRSIADVIYNPEIDIVVELVGGIKPAKDIVIQALRAGKHVVTANKALLSECGSEIFGLADSLGLSVGFEASVGGGIPIIRSLRDGFVADRIDLIYGIINGTSNFILTSMAEDGLDFDAALKIAQEKGYAERDPFLDISGGDSSHKLSILARLGFGIDAAPSEIYTEGIVDIEAVDIEYARDMGYAIKLLAIAKRSGNEVELRVHPTFIPKKHLLASVNDVFNAIFVKGDLVGENMFYGRGAGAAPTSSAIVGDIVSIAQNIGGLAPKAPGLKNWVSGVKDMDEVRTRHYFRFSTADKPGVLAKISGILAKYGISIASVTQKEKKSSRVVPIVMMTHEAREKDMAKALKEIGSLSAVKSKPVRIRVEG